MASLPEKEMYPQEPQGAMPREALAGEPPAIEAVIISWKPNDWNWLLAMKRYVTDNPDDTINKLVYKNYLKWYRTHCE